MNSRSVFVVAIVWCVSGAALAAEPDRVQCRTKTTDSLGREVGDPIQIDMPQLSGAQVDGCYQMTRTAHGDAVFIPKVVPATGRGFAPLLAVEDGAELFALASSGGDAAITGRETVKLLGQSEVLIRSRAQFGELKDAEVLVARVRTGDYFALFQAVYPFADAGAQRARFKRLMEQTRIQLARGGELKGVPTVSRAAPTVECVEHGIRFELPLVRGAFAAQEGCRQELGVTRPRLLEFSLKVLKKGTSDEADLALADDGIERQMQSQTDGLAKKVWTDRVGFLGDDGDLKAFQVQPPREPLAEILVGRARIGEFALVVTAFYPASQAARFRPLVKSAIENIGIVRRAPAARGEP